MQLRPPCYRLTSNMYPKRRHTTDDSGPRSLAESIIDDLRRAILDGTMRPGSRLKQEAIAAELGMSRVPVREALRQLENEGLVTIVPHRGARVAKFDIDDLLEIYKMREVLEPLAIRESTPNLTTEQLREIEALDHAIERSDDFQHWLDADRRFHLATYQGARMPHLLKLIEELQNATQQYRRVYLVLAEEQQRRLLHAEHSLILDALRRRDAQCAQWRLQAHILQTRMVLSAHPEAFEESKSATELANVRLSAFDLGGAVESSDEKE